MSINLNFQANEKKVSVIIPVIADNVCDETIESLFKQDLDNIEILFCVHKNVNAQVLKRLKDFQLSRQTIQIIEEKWKDFSDLHFFVKNYVKGSCVFFYTGQTIQRNFLTLMYDKINKTESDIVACNSSTETISDMDQNSVYCRYDIPLSLFQIMPKIECCLFKSEFLKKLDLDFCSKIYFTWQNCYTGAAFSLAKKISFIDSNLVDSNPNNLDVFFCEDDCCSFFKDYNQFYEFLIRHKCYDILESSFIQNFIENFKIFETTYLHEPIKSFFDMELLSGKFFSYDFFGQETMLFALSEILFKGKLSQNLKQMWSVKKKDIVPIVFCCLNQDDIFSIMVTIQSILEYVNPKKFYDIYILINGEINTAFKKTTESISKNNVRVSCLNVNQYVNNLFSEQQSQAETWTTFIPEILCNYEKIIFLKKNLLVQKDLSVLMENFKEDYVIAGVSIHNNFVLDTSFLLLNLKKMRDSSNMFQEDSFQNWLITLTEKTQFLDVSWNCPVDLFVKKKKSLASLNSVGIINYFEYLSGAYPNTNASMWWSYAQKSLFYERILLECLPIKEKVEESVLLPSQKNSFSETDKAEIYSLQAKFVKEVLLYIFSFSEKRKRHKKNIEALIAKIYGN